MSREIAATVAHRLGLKCDRVENVLDLLARGLHPCCIAAYHKAATGGMEEDTVRRVAEARDEVASLESLRDEVLTLTEGAGVLTDDLRRRIEEATERHVLEDMAAPFRPGRRTAATVARQRGLAPLARYILLGAADGPDLETKAAEFVDPEREVASVEDALAGAEHLLADRVGHDYELRQAVRQFVREKGVLKAAKAKKAGKAAREFKGYFNFSEPLKNLPAHRSLAINRGEKRRALKVTVEVPREELETEAVPRVVPEGHRFHGFLKSVVSDALDRLILPTIDREVRRDITEKAEGHAIEVFAANLRGLLMAPPQGDIRVLALQPGFRSGCKVAVLDEAGGLLDETIIYPFQPQNQRDEAVKTLTELVERDEIDVVAIGNGTGCHDAEELVTDVIEAADRDLVYTIVNEAGASVYADSDAAKAEFQNLDAAVRATISIGRRLQDPLGELVKIDPRAVGVGLYQHDVDQGRLKRELDETIRSCIAAVGVDVNAAPAAMLRYVPGLAPEQVEAVLSCRDKEPIDSIDQLSELPGWDEQAVRRVAGFLRVRGGSQPLDGTRLHPDQYDLARRVIERVGLDEQRLADPASQAAVEEALTGLPLEATAEALDVPLAELMDVVAAIQHPWVDPRDKQPGPIYRERIQRIEDFQPGMWVKGTVRNVVDFGAFVDIGLKEDGLIHISQFSKKYVRNPLKFLHVGDVVDARIVSIDADRGRIALSLISDGKKPNPDASTSRSPGGRKRGKSESQRKGKPPGKRGKRRKSSGPKRPKVRVFRDKTASAEATETDEKGRPKLRWAVYESDEKDETPGDEDKDGAG